MELEPDGVVTELAARQACPLDGVFAINVSSSALLLILIMADRPIYAFIAGYVPTIPYNVIVCVGVWRSADRYAG